MLRCLILSTSCYAASPSRCHTTLPGIFVWIFEFVFILLCCLIVFTSCRTAWPLIATSYYLLYLLQITVFQLDLVFVVPTLHGVICFMLPCFTLSTSCQTASCPLDKVKLFDLVFTVLRCLTFSTSCYHDWPFPRQALPLHLNNMILPVRGWIWSQWYYSETLLGLHCLVLRCFIFPASCRTAWCPHRVTLFNLVLMNACMIFYASCWTCEPPLPQCNAAWCPLYHVMLFHLDFMMLRCLIFSVLCCAAGPSLPHVKVLGVP